MTHPLRTLAVLAATTLVGTSGLLAPASAATLGSSEARSQVSARSCGDWQAVYAPIGGKWSRSYSGTCAHIDRGTKPQHYVSWSRDAASSGQMCVRARGYRWSDGKAYWVSLGCGTGGGGYVHWGKSGGPGVSSINKVQGKSQNIVTGVPGHFID